MGHITILDEGSFALYSNRTLSSQIRATSKQFPILLVTKPRQVGKTILLQNCTAEERQYVTLDDLDTRELAKKDPALFLQKYQPPLIIDEVQ